MSLADAILDPGRSFKAFSFDHAIAIIVCIILGVLFIGIGKRVSERTSEKMGQGLGVFISSAVLAYSIILIYRGEWDAARDMPFAICNFSAYFAPVLMFSRSKRVYNIFYFWVMFATIQAMITPDLHYVFPYYVYIKFWIVHGGLVLAVLFLTIVKGYRPTYKGLWLSFFALELFIIFLFVYNAIFDTNHMYLSHKPPVASALDLMGDWPMYIIVTHLIALVGFHLVYLPFALRNRKRNA